MTPTTDAVILELPRSQRYARNGVLGTAIFVFTEVMLFTGFISAFLIVRGSVLPGMWPPEHQPRLPFARTAVNTLALLASGALLFVAGRRFRRVRPAAALPWMTGALALGAFFVIFQGMEWAALLRQGLTLTSSQLGAFFYLIIGAHGLHAVAALIAMSLGLFALRAGRLGASRLGAIEVFWYFVVLIWPALYLLVYR